MGGTSRWRRRARTGSGSPPSVDCATAGGGAREAADAGGGGVVETFIGEGGVGAI